MKPFAERFPALFHVTDRAALPGIRADGLLSAARLCARHGVDAAAQAVLLDRNRDGFLPVAAGAVLRRQGMPDGPLSRRLAPGLDHVGWRRLINGKVFLFARSADADRLRRHEAARDQVVIRFETAALLGAGLLLHACRFNNGFLDRRPANRPRLRSAADYVPLPDWTFGVPKEVTVDGAIPPGLGFDLLPDAGPFR